MDEYTGFTLVTAESFHGNAHFLHRIIQLQGTDITSFLLVQQTLQFPFKVEKGYVYDKLAQHCKDLHPNHFSTTSKKM